MIFNLKKIILALTSLLIYTTTFAAGVEVPLPPVQQAKISFNATWLYWRPTGALTDYATLVNINNDQIAAKPLGVDQEFDSGYKLDGTYHFKNGINDIAFSYTHFNHSYQDGPINAPNAIRVVEVSSPNLNSVFYDATGARLNYDFDAFEVSTGFSSSWEHGILRILLGIRYVELSSKINAHYDRNDGSFIHIMQSQFHGIGPVVGAHFSYPLFKGLSIKFLGELGILTGDLEVKARLSNSTGTTPIAAQNSLKTRYATSPFYDVNISLEQAFTFKQDNQLLVNIGYASTHYENAYIRRPGTSSASEKNIGFSGPFASLGVIFGV